MIYLDWFLVIYGLLRWIGSLVRKILIKCNVDLLLVDCMLMWKVSKFWCFIDGFWFFNCKCMFIFFCWVSFKVYVFMFVIDKCGWVC